MPRPFELVARSIDRTAETMVDIYTYRVNLMSSDIQNIDCNKVHFAVVDASWSFLKVRIYVGLDMSFCPLSKEINIYIWMGRPAPSSQGYESRCMVVGYHHLCHGHGQSPYSKRESIGAHTLQDICIIS